MTDTTPAMIVNHAFRPDGMWWETCAHCGLAEAAHVASESRVVADVQLAHEPFRCPDCVSARDFGKDMPHAAGECRKATADAAWCGTPKLIALQQREASS